MNLSLDRMSRPLNELEEDTFNEGMRYVHETLDSLIAKREKELQDRGDDDASDLQSTGIR